MPGMMPASAGDGGLAGGGVMAGYRLLHNIKIKFRLLFIDKNETFRVPRATLSVPPHLRHVIASPP